MKIAPSKNHLNLNGKNLKIAVVFSTFNSSIGDKLLRNTVKYLKTYGVAAKNIDIFSVPGSLEIPLIAKFIAKKKKHHAIITLGIIIKGETPHFDLVMGETHRGLMDVNLHLEIPVIFGILTAYNVKQAEDRASEHKLNKGKEFAETAIKMAHLIKDLK